MQDCTGLVLPDGKAVSREQAVKGGSVLTRDVNVGPDAHCLQTLLPEPEFSGRCWVGRGRQQENSFALDVYVGKRAQQQGLCLQTPEPLPDQSQNFSWSGKEKQVSHLLDMEEGVGWAGLGLHCSNGFLSCSKRGGGCSLD